ncbi:hypothetical protein [Pseudomonas folii]|jgi:hypothetical protein|nr:hypothetical protein [Pseudomonas folii]
MARFSVYSGTTLVGYSALENTDPSMGVAFGQFDPADGYRLIQSECRANHSDQSALALTVETSDGQVIPCAGVGILDYSVEYQDDYIEVNVLGIHDPFYAELFAD